MREQALSLLVRRPLFSPWRLSGLSLRNILLLCVLSSLSSVATAQLRDVADRLEQASERFAKASKDQLGNKRTDAAEQLLREAGVLEDLGDDLKAEIRRSGNPRVLNARSAEIFDAMSIRRTRITGLMSQVAPSTRMSNEWTNTQRLMNQVNGTGAIARSNTVNTAKAAPAGYGGFVDQIEDGAERTKNAFRDHMRKHSELKAKGWATALSGALSAFDQDANALRDNFRKRNIKNENVIARMKSRAKAISESMQSQTVGPTARAQWQRVMNNLNRL